MPWWSYVYLVLFVGLGLLGIWDDLAHARNPLLPTIGALCTLVGACFYLSYWHPNLTDFLGKGALAVYLTALSLEAYWAYSDLRYPADPRLEDRRNAMIGTLIAFLLTAPAYIVGGMALSNGN